MPTEGWSMPGFLKNSFAQEVGMCVCVCVGQPPRLLRNSGMIHMP